MSLYALIAIGFINGSPVAAEIMPMASAQACHDEAVKSAKDFHDAAPKDEQVVYKCVDLNQLNNELSVFGSK